MTHTPGPFTIAQIDHCKIGGFYAILPPDAPPVAYVANRDDARLYAAAPELLAVLKALHEWDVENDMMPLKLYLQINNAIAKTEGK